MASPDQNNGNGGTKDEVVLRKQLSSKPKEAVAGQTSHIRRFKNAYKQFCDQMMTVQTGPTPTCDKDISVLNNSNTIHVTSTTKQKAKGSSKVQASEKLAAAQKEAELEAQRHAKK